MPDGFTNEEYLNRYGDLEALLASVTEHDIWLYDVEGEFGVNVAEEIKARWEAAEKQDGPLTPEQAEKARKSFNSVMRAQRYPKLMNRQMAIDFCEAYSVGADGKR